MQQKEKKDLEQLQTKKVPLAEALHRYNLPPTILFQERELLRQSKLNKRIHKKAT